MWGGEITNAVFSTIYQFNPATTIPLGGFDLKITDVNFDSSIYPGEQEYFQGQVVVNNIGIDISYNPSLVYYQWNYATATFKLTLDLPQLGSDWKTMLNWTDVPTGFNASVYDPSATSADSSNSIYVNLHLRDVSIERAENTKGLKKIVGKLSTASSKKHCIV